MIKHFMLIAQFFEIITKPVAAFIGKSFRIISDAYHSTKSAYSR